MTIGVVGSASWAEGAAAIRHAASVDAKSAAPAGNRGDIHGIIALDEGRWYRGPFEHNGSVATLEDWFDPRRLEDSYVPTGFKGVGVDRRAVKGHPFGLQLSADEKQALIAFLRTL